EEVLYSCVFVHTTMARAPFRNFLYTLAAISLEQFLVWTCPRSRQPGTYVFFEKPFGLRFPRDFAFGCSLIFL
ncbi:hypothetical protein, partial [Delftia acidovorans]|uniref:hypothetical protein n=1 Tax=Delftia acidovorans TaxID=80866 RepID=UPI0035A0A691